MPNKAVSQLTVMLSGEIASDDLLLIARSGVADYALPVATFLTTSGLGLGAGLTSGAVTSGFIGNQSITSGRLASGSAMGRAGGGPFIIASGTIASFDIASGGILSGNVASGQIGINHLALNVVISGKVASGAVIGQAGGGPFNIGSGTINAFDVASGVFLVSGAIPDSAITSGKVASGAVTGQAGGGFFVIASGTVGTFDIGSGAIVSGRIASGVVGINHLTLNVVVSGKVASGAVIGSLGGGPFNIGSGTIGPLDVGSGGILSGNVASGQIGFGHLANASVRSGTVASGQLSKFHFASGATIDSSEWTIEDTFATAERISGSTGGIAVAFTQSGTLQTAMASVSGRMPAIGVVIADVVSGATATVFRGGRVFSTVFNFSGWMNQPVYVGRSGQLSASGAPTLSGDIQQIIGVSTNQSGLMVQVGDPLEQAVAASGDIGSGAVTGQAGGGFFSIASGTIAATDLASGIVGSLYLANSSVVSGKVASGAVAGQAGGGFFGIASGSVGTFDIGSGAIVSGRIASGVVGINHLALNVIVSGKVASGAITGQAAGGVFNIASGSIGAFDLASGLLISSGFIPDASVTSGKVASGAVTGQAGGGFFVIASGTVASFDIGSGAIVSGRIASGVVGINHLALNVIVSGKVASGAITGQAAGGVFNIASGSIGAFDLASGLLISSGFIPDGSVTSGKAASGAVTGQAGGGFFVIASGTITTNDIGSGAIISGNIASGVVGINHLALNVVVSGKVASGAVTGQAGGGPFNVGSGTIGTFDIGSGAIVSGRIASGVVGINHLALNVIISGKVASGAITGQAAGGVFNIASGSIGVFDLASGLLISSGFIPDGSVVSGKVASGAVTGQAGGGFFCIASGTVASFDIGSGAIVSGRIASGVVGINHLALNVIISGKVASGSVIGSLGGGPFNIGSGTIGPLDIGSGGILSGNIASGVVGVNHLALNVVVSGKVTSGAVIGQAGGGPFNIGSGTIGTFDIASGAILSGSLGSGQISKFKFASGATIDSAEWLIEDTFTTAERVSGSVGGIAVAFTQSGTLQTAMAAVSGRMPAIGVVIADVVSGALATVYREGRLFSTALNFSGWMNQPVYVGRSGQLSASGSPNSSGDIQQIVGVSTNQSGLLLQVGDPFEQIILASGDVGSGAVTGQGGGGYFTIASGTINNNDTASGLYAGRIVQWFTTAELISGLKAVAVASGDGSTIVRAERQSGLRLPAVGVTISGAASGIACQVVSFGAVLGRVSGMLASGFHTRSLYVGSGGLIVNQSGFGDGPSSGDPFLSGSAIQKLGYAISGGIFVNPGELRSGLLTVAGQGIW